jgi:DNA-binding LytR/AlgR family response regulator
LEVKKMYVSICDDSLPFAQALRERIVNYCARFDYDCVCKIYTDPLKLLEADLSLEQVLFLDVDMPKINGIDVARQLRERLPELIIVYVTNWVQYAPYGYQVSAFRYLLKSNLENEFPACMDAAFEKLKLDSARVVLSGKNGQFTMPVPQILYFEGASGRRVYLHTAGNGKAVMECVTKLSELEAELSEQGFLRIQRSFLVNMQHITQMRNYEVLLSNGERLKTSRQQFSEVKSAYTLWRVNKL